MTGIVREYLDGSLVLHRQRIRGCVLVSQCTCGNILVLKQEVAESRSAGRKLKMGNWPIRSLYADPPGCHFPSLRLAGPHGAGAFPVFVAFVFEFPFSVFTGSGSYCAEE